MPAFVPSQCSSITSRRSQNRLRRTLSFSGEKVRVHAPVGRFRCQCFDIYIYVHTHIIHTSMYYTFPTTFAVGDTAWAYFHGFWAIDLYIFDNTICRTFGWERLSEVLLVPPLPVLEVRLEHVQMAIYGNLWQSNAGLSQSSLPPGPCR